MAASERQPGSSCSHALKDSQDPPHPKDRPSWGLAWGLGETEKGLEFAKPRSSVVVIRVDFSSSRPAWQQVQLRPRLLWDVELNSPLFYIQPGVLFPPLDQPLSQKVTSF